MISPFFVYMLYVLLISACLGNWAKKSNVSNQRAFLMALAWGIFVSALWIVIGE